MEQEPIGKLTTKEKLGFISLVILTVGVIYLGFNQLQNTIKSPSAIFALEHTSKIAPEKTEDQAKEELKKKDTDHDGLSDYDELYIYHTSPYLADSDSDGIPDGEEVANGTDPNCPKGQTCGIREISNPTAAGYVTSTVELSPVFVPSNDQVLLKSMFGDKPDPKALRDFLIKQGMDQKSLDSFSDEELLNYYKEIISQPVPSSAASAVVAAPPATQDNNLLDAKTVRALLVKQGMSEAELSKIDDATLLQAASQLLKK